MKFFCEWRNFSFVACLEVAEKFMGVGCGQGPKIEVFPLTNFFAECQSSVRLMSRRIGPRFFEL